MSNKTIKEFTDKIKHACKQCGDINDFMVIFTNHPICGKCVRKNHKNAIA